MWLHLFWSWIGFLRSTCCSVQASILWGSYVHRPHSVDSCMRLWWHRSERNNWSEIMFTQLCNKCYCIQTVSLRVIIDWILILWAYFRCVSFVWRANYVILLLSFQSWNFFSCIRMTLEYTNKNTPKKTPVLIDIQSKAEECKQFVRWKA